MTISTGIITSLAGGGSSGFGISTTAGYSGDGGDSTSAELNRPIDVALDSSGSNCFFMFIYIYLYMFLKVTYLSLIV